MTEKGKQILEKLDKVIVNKDDLNTLQKDRLDFGFDSIYFRYAEVCDELAMYKAMVEHSNPIEEKKHMWCKKQHFYNTLEQLIHAHEDYYKGGSKT